MRAVSAAQWPEGRIDPDEPYRYACPECGSVRVGRASEDTYGCVNCDARTDHVIDQKHDERVTP